MASSSRRSRRCLRAPRWARRSSWVTSMVTASPISRHRITSTELERSSYGNEQRAEGRTEEAVPHARGSHDGAGVFRAAAADVDLLAERGVLSGCGPRLLP